MLCEMRDTVSQKNVVLLCCLMKKSDFPNIKIRFKIANHHMCNLCTSQMGPETNFFLALGSYPPQIKVPWARSRTADIDTLLFFNCDVQ